MVRTLIELTDDAYNRLMALAAATGQPRETLIREAIDRLIAESGSDRRAEALRASAGMWKDRDDLPDFRKLREEWDRG